MHSWMGCRLMIDGMEEGRMGRRPKEEGVKSTRRGDERTGAEETDSITYLWDLILTELKSPLPSSLSCSTPEIYYAFHHTDATQGTTDPSPAPPLSSLWNLLLCPFALLQN